MGSQPGGIIDRSRASRLQPAHNTTASTSGLRTGGRAHARTFFPAEPLWRAVSSGQFVSRPPSEGTVDRNEDVDLLRCHRSSSIIPQARRSRKIIWHGSVEGTSTEPN